MMGRILIFFVLVVVSVFIWAVSLQYDVIYMDKLLQTTVALAGIYLIFKIILEEIVAKRISDPKPRYSFRKAVSITYLALFTMAIIAIWIESPEALLVTYGLIAAGIAVALQDLFKSLAGGMILLISRPYKVGDRIQINKKEGDVIDIDLLYTTILEIKEWVGGDQATGRLTVIPNYFVISSQIDNYTKDNEFIWDEIKIPITYESDWKGAIKIMKDIASKETRETMKMAEKDISKIQEKYYFSGRGIEPEIFVALTDNWVELTVRYVTHIRKRRSLKADISRLILEKIEKSKNIKIASTTLSIVDIPDIKMKK